MKQYIQLKHGIAIIDQQDDDRINQYKWHSVDMDKSGRYYVTCSIKGKTVYMHRMVMGAQSGETIDHIDGNGLNNCSENLRFVIPSQNSMNQKIRNDNTSGHKGISWCPDREKYQVYINIDRKRKSLGRYKTIEEAIYVRDKSIKSNYGEYARDNSSLPENTEIEPQRAIPRTLRRKGTNNSSGKTGVTKHKGKWKASITIDGKPKHIGIFSNVEDAIAARKNAELQYFSDYLRDAA